MISRSFNGSYSVVTPKCVVLVAVGERHEMSPEKVAQEKITQTIKLLKGNFIL